jgi:DNA excision repair protein ERCC-4
MAGLVSIVADTREQAPYAFDSNRFSVERRALPAGDYSLVGSEERVAVERKSLADFAQTVIRARRRFHEELKKLAACEFGCVVVEGSMRDVIEGAFGTGAHPNAVFGAAISICVDWGVPVYFCGDRQTAKQFVEAYLERCARAINERDLG